MGVRSRIAAAVVDPTFRVVSNSRFGTLTETLASRFLDLRRGFSYDFWNNGEAELVRACLLGAAESHGSAFTFLDVGANQGDWTAELLASWKGSGELAGHLFDVSETMAEVLCRRFAEHPGLTVNHLALSDTATSVQFRRFPNREIVNTLLVNSDFWGSLDSEVVVADSVTGDAYCTAKGIQHIALLKIDTEGWEWPVVNGFDRMLRENRVGVVQFEYGYTSADLGFLMRDFFSHFQQLGYRVGPLRKRGVEFRDFRYSDNDFKSGPNYVAALPSIAPTLESFAMT